MTEAEHLERMIWICERLAQSPFIIMLAVIVVALMFAMKYWRV